MCHHAGGAGAVVLDRSNGDDRCLRILPHRVQAIDTVGAGDAFCGALAAGLAAGRTLAAAARVANAAGALATTVTGAATAMPTTAATAELLDSSQLLWESF